MSPATRPINPRDIRRDSERSLTIGPGLVIDPFDVKTWPPEHQRGHRLRRALHELIPHPDYRIVIGVKPDGMPGIRIESAHDISNDARAFLTHYREELISYMSWLELMRDASNEALAHEEAA